MYDYTAVREATSTYAISSNIDNTVFSKVIYALKFGDQVSLMLYFYPAEGASINPDAFTVDGKPVEATYDASGRYVVTLFAISVTKLGIPHDVAYGSTNIHVSPYSYVYAMLGMGEDHNLGKNLVCALYYLAQSCTIYKQV